MQEPGLAVRAGHRDRSEPAGLVGACGKRGREFSEMLLGVWREAGDARCGYPVVVVAGQYVSPGRGQLVRTGDPSERGVQVVRRSRRGGHRAATRMLGGCQVGSGTMVPKPYAVCEPAPANAANASSAAKQPASVPVPSSQT